MGSIVIRDNANIRVHSNGGAGIGSGAKPYNTFDMSPITIQDNAKVHASSHGTNSSGIGTSYASQMMQINITDNANIIAVSAAEYNPSKYKDNMVFGNFLAEASGAGIGKASQLTLPFEGEDSINISGTPTIVAGGNFGGILSTNGNVNISGTNTKIDILTRRLITEEDVINNPDIYEDKKIGTYSQGKYGAGVGIDPNEDYDTPTVNINDAYLNIITEKGAGIGSTSRDTNNYNVNININNSNMNIESQGGAGIGTGQQSYKTFDIYIKDSNITADSKSGAGIGSGLYASII